MPAPQYDDTAPMPAPSDSIPTSPVIPAPTPAERAAHMAPPLTFSWPVIGDRISRAWASLWGDDVERIEALQLAWCERRFVAAGIELAERCNECRLFPRDVDARKAWLHALSDFEVAAMQVDVVRGKVVGR